MATDRRKRLESRSGRSARTHAASTRRQTLPAYEANGLHLTSVRVRLMTSLPEGVPDRTGIIPVRDRAERRLGGQLGRGFAGSRLVERLFAGHVG